MGPGPLDGMRTARSTAVQSLVVALLMLAIGLATLPATGDPVAEAGPDIQDYTGRPVVFEGFGTPDTSLRIILFEWDFDGDGVYDWNSTRTGRCTNRFSEPGQYNSTLRVTQLDGNTSSVLTDTDHTRVTIRSGRPVGDVTSGTTAQVDSPHRLRAEYYDPDGGILEFQWRVDGEHVSDEASFRHTFEELGKFEVTLTVTDDEDETETESFTVEVVEEVEDTIDLSDHYVMIGAVLAIFVVAILAYVAVLRGPKDRDLKTYDDLGTEAAPIVPEASLTDEQADPAPRKKPRIVRPELVLASTDKSKEGEEAVPAAPPKVPCSECGTTLDDEGECPFCTANEEIDQVEKSVRELQEDGFILAKADEELESAKTELHVKNFESVAASLSNARELMEVAVRDHERCMDLMNLVDELLGEADERDLDVTKAANLQKLSRSFMKSGKYPKSIYYAERSRDFLLDTLEPFDLDRYFCEHCRAEVGEGDDHCPHCDQDIESGLIKRAKRELAELKRRLEGISRDHEDHTPIAAQLEKVDEHVASRSASAAQEHIERARVMLDGVEGTPEQATGPTHGEGMEGTEEGTEEEPRERTEEALDDGPERDPEGDGE